MIILQLLCYFSIALFLVLSIAKIIKVASMPVHLRWELYPVPHEKGRAHYGGSKMEESEWWTKDHKKDHFNEYKEMGKEILFLKAVWKFNRSLWIGSFPFHLALYMMIANMFLLLVGAIMQLSGVDLSPSDLGFGYIYYYFLSLILWTASVIGAFGAVRLMFSRIVDTGLRNHSSISHYFNIIFIAAIYLTSLLWLISGNNPIEMLTDFYASLITFSSLPDLPSIAVAHIVISALFILYLPFTHMSHMYMKYFLYHLVRWEDNDIKPGSSLSEKLGKQLAYPVAWSAAHIGADGKKNWGDIVNDIPEEM